MGVERGGGCRENRTFPYTALNVQRGEKYANIFLARGWLEGALGLLQGGGRIGVGVGRGRGGGKERGGRRACMHAQRALWSTHCPCRHARPCAGTIP